MGIFMAQRMIPRWTPAPSFSLVQRAGSQRSPVWLALPACLGRLCSKAAMGIFIPSRTLVAIPAQGAVISVTADGIVALVASFDGANGFPGWSANAPLIQGAAGDFYGVTELGQHGLPPPSTVTMAMATAPAPIL